MDVFQDLMSSNLFQTLLTFLCGSMLYFVTNIITATKSGPPFNLRAQFSALFEKYKDVNASQNTIFPKWLFCFLGIMIPLLISISFIFNVGEVYQYTDYYKRAFGFFSDEIPYVLILFALVFLLSDSFFYTSFALLAILMCGSKMALMCLFIAVAAVVTIHSNMRRRLAVRFGSALGMAFICYVLAIFISLGLSKTWCGKTVKNMHKKAVEYIGIEIEDTSLKGHNSASTVKKLISNQLYKPIFQRVASSIGGAWMTLQGGFRGESYPSTRKDFADLMMAKNPWGINDKYGITWIDWWRMGVPQNAYTRFGSGYGYYGLGILMFFLAGVSFMAIANIVRGERGLNSSLSIFFLLTVFVNQTQPWISSGSFILFALGFCCAHIVVTYFVANLDTIKRHLKLLL